MAFTLLRGCETVKIARSLGAVVPVAAAALILQAVIVHAWMATARVRLRQPW